MPALTRVRPLALALLLAGCASTASTTGASTHGGAATPLVVVVPTEPREQTADQQVQQVLNRLAFGARPGDVVRVRAMGVDQWIALQLAPDRIYDRAGEVVLASYYELNRPTSEFLSMYEEGQKAIRQLQKQAAGSGDSAAKKDLRAEALRDNPQLREQVRRNQRILGDVQSAKLARAVASDRQLQEVMTDFWENHFTVYAGKGITRLFIPAYDREVIRPRAMGKFRDLLGAVAKSPAMLFYLDQFQSAADSMHPTLASNGRPVAARAGRRAVRPAMRPRRPGGMSVEEVERLAPGGKLTDEQRARLQAMTPEQREELVQQRVQQAQRGRGLNENYARELMELHTLGVDGGYTQSDVIAVARALTGWTMQPRQKAEFTFRPEIHDAGEKIVLAHALAAGRGEEDGEEVLDILARDPHTARFIARKLAIRFVSDNPPAALVDRAAETFRRTDGDIREVVRTIVTSPEFFGRSAYRSKVKSPFELVASALRALGAQPDTSMRSAQVVGFLGQPIFGHQAPNGWPETGDAWMNTGAILNRINFGLALAAGRLPVAGVSQWPEAERLRGLPRDQQVDGVIAAFLGGHASPDTRDILLKGENPMVAKLVASDTALRGGDANMQLEADLKKSDAGEGSMMNTTATAGARARRMAAADDARVAMRDQPPARNGQPRPAIQRGLGQPVQLSGLAQIVGLAIGAPEFQRR